MKLILANDDHFAENCKALSREKSDHGRHAPSVMTILTMTGESFNVTGIRVIETAMEHTIELSTPFDDEPLSLHPETIDCLEVIW